MEIQIYLKEKRKAILIEAALIKYLENNGLRIEMEL